MKKAQQIDSLLSDTTFWEGDQVRSLSTPDGGMTIDIDQKGTNWTPSISKPNWKPWLCPKSFPTVQEAKNELRGELMRRRKCLE